VQVKSDAEGKPLNGVVVPNGTVMNGEVSTGSGGADSPFTIQGYAERYKDNNNHSEISC